MSEFSGVKCDGRNCARVKGESNHWLKMVKLEDHLSLWRATDEHAPVPTSDRIVLDFCSPACVVTAVTGWLERPIAEPAEPDRTALEVAGERL